MTDTITRKQMTGPPVYITTGREKGKFYADLIDIEPVYKKHKGGLRGVNSANVLRRLVEAYVLLDDRKSWIKGMNKCAIVLPLGFGTDTYKVVGYDYCLAGAINEVTKYDVPALRDAVRLAVRWRILMDTIHKIKAYAKPTGPTGPPCPIAWTQIEEWNDADGRTYREMRALLRKTMEYVETCGMLTPNDLECCLTTLHDLDW